MDPLMNVLETASAWNIAVQQRRLQDKTIHGDALKSASKIGDEQFLLLRVIWKSHRKADSFRKALGQWLNRAQAELADDTCWKTYLGGLEKDRKPRGTFALARHYQAEACSEELKFKEECLDTPVAKHTRSHTNRNPPTDLESLFGGLSVEDSPTRSRSTGLSTSLVPMTPPGQTSAYGISYGTPDFSNEETPSPLQSLTPGPEELRRVMYPPMKDEQIVNTALVLFLNALTMYQNLKVSWTMHRIPLRASFNPHSFVARTDGYLSDEEGNPLVLIEVKPVTRNTKLTPIRMQESAQMVAWIKAYEDGAHAPRKMRTIISQDRHEIFITVADCKVEYVRYLQGVSGASNNISLMTMHEYDPWNTGSAADMHDKPN
ncbi:hypothetical protein BJY00DRAFT_308557 [Aspergillus carlsbadensis]|nr:hypothetical protein BJY00DRAFT_308557 [Aspergillus carlsbadensis]